MKARSTLGLGDRELILDVATRWNSTYEMLARAIPMKSAIQMALEKQDRGQYYPSGADWQAASRVLIFLQAFNTASDFIGGEEYPTLMTTIPLFNNCFDWVEDFASPEGPKVNDWIVNKLPAEFAGEQPFWIQEAATRAHIILKKYYKECRLVHILAMYADPCNKSEYFDHHGWKEDPFHADEILKAVDKFEEIYPEAEPVMKKLEPSVSFGQNTGDAQEELSRSADFARPGAKRRKITARSAGKDLEKYLADPVVEEAIVLNWWKTIGSEQYPSVARMARDVLSIPATSVPVERAFSSGGQMVTDIRNRLSADTVNAAQCLRSWWKGPIKEGLNAVFDNECIE